MQKKNISLNVPVNYYCNLNCIFCADSNKEMFTYLKGKENKYVYELLEEGKDKYSKVMFTAGEPTLNKNIINYIKQARKLGYKNIGLITNGTQLYRKKLRCNLINSGLNQIIISIHGSNEYIYEKNVGVKGMYKKVLFGLIKLIKEYNNIEINISFVLNKYNLNDLFTSIVKYKSLGINIFIVNTMRPYGYGYDRMKDLSIKYIDFVNYINSLPKKYLKYLNILIEKNKLNIMDIPICIIKQTNLDIKIYGKVEIRVVDKLKTLNTIRHKIYLNKCFSCKYNNYCEGIYTRYLDVFGVNEFN